MNPLSKQYDKIVNVERLTPGGVDGHEEYAVNITDLACHIQPLDESFTEDVDGNFGKDSMLFCDQTDIVEGDRIKLTDDYGTMTYKVIGIEKFNFQNDNHMELRIRQSLKYDSSNNES